jgi:hypothetical protein
MRRHAIAAVTVILLFGAAALWLWRPTDSGPPALEAAFWRVGMLMALVWLSYPDLKRLPAWLIAVAPVVIILVAARPRWSVYLIPPLLLIGVLRSKRPQRHGDAETRNR